MPGQVLFCRTATKDTLSQAWLQLRARKGRDDRKNSTLCLCILTPRHSEQGLKTKYTHYYRSYFQVPQGQPKSKQQETQK